MKKYFFLAILLIWSIAGAATPNYLRVGNTIGWTFHPEIGTPGVKDFNLGAIGWLDLDKDENVVPAKVLINAYPIPANTVLGTDVAAWHRFIFPNPATASVSMVEEYIRTINGNPRYFVRFETNTAAMINSQFMATVVGGRVLLVRFEGPRDYFIRSQKEAEILLHRIKLEYYAPAQ